MSAAIKAFFTKIQQNFNMRTKLTRSWSVGNRIVPSKTSKNDKEYQLRLDAGALVDDRWRNVYLQVNSQATSTKLKEWARKNSTHANLAEGLVDTKAEDLEAEVNKVLDEMESEAKDNL